MNHTQEISGRFDPTWVTSAPNEKVLGGFSRSFGKNKQPQEAPDPVQAVWAEKRGVPASVCCGEDMGLGGGHRARDDWYRVGSGPHSGQ